MIEWIPYESRLPESHVMHLISNGIWIAFGIHRYDHKSSSYKWFDGENDTVTDVTHFAKINYPRKVE